MGNYKTTMVYAKVINYILTHTNRKRRRKMKKIAIQIFVIGTIITTYALPVLAYGGAGP
jgi:hypothetical protein